MNPTVKRFGDIIIHPTSNEVIISMVIHNEDGTEEEYIADVQDVKTTREMAKWVLDNTGKEKQ